MIVKSLALFLLFSWPSLQEALAEQVPVAVPLVTQDATGLRPVNEASARVSQTQKTAKTHSLTRMQHCFQEIDQATRSYENGRADIARSRLSLLTQSCGTIPHLFHNLGAIAVLERDWNKAIGYFEQSLSLDTRAAMTQNTLTSIYQYKAALAYKSALDLSGPEPKMPSAQMQPSDLRNNRATQFLNNDSSGGLVNFPGSRIATPKYTLAELKLLMEEVHFEVSSWWQAQRQYDIETYFAYYSSGVHPAHFDSNEQWNKQWTEWQQSQPALLPAWMDVQFEVEPLDDYMLVNLQFHSDASSTDLAATSAATDSALMEQGTEQGTGQHNAHRLLVMQKIDQTWQIIKEKSW